MTTKKSILDDPRYPAFVKRYCVDITRFAIEVFGITPTFQQEEMYQSVAPFGSRTSVTSGHGCFALGTSIMRRDGSSYPVEDVRVGDKLMGADGRSERNVIELRRGREAMYRFTYMDGSSHTFNESHILCLRTNAHQDVLLTVRDYLQLQIDERAKYSCYRLIGANPAEYLLLGISSVEPLGEGDYYGFALDGDNKFLGGDRTVLHNTGKTQGFSVIGLWHLLCYHHSNTFLHAPKLKTITDGVWKEFAARKSEILKGKHAWIAEYLEIESMRVYVKGFKLNWFISPRSAPKGSPENLAGAHNYALLWLLDECSGIPDANWGVISGSMTDARNRACCASQPTRQSGFFYDQHHSLSQEEGGIWNALGFSSIDSPLVSDEFLLEKKAQYSLEEWLIKVVGKFCELSGKYLTGAAAIEACVGKEVIRDDEEYGWFILGDIGGGGYRDDTVLLCAKVIGHGEYGIEARRVQLVAVPMCSNSIDPTDVYGSIIEETGKLSNATAIIDGGGIGLSVIKQLEKNDFTNLIKVLWGSPNFKKEYKERYVNQRAQACCGIARAVQDGRFGISADIPKSIVKKIVKQGSRIPYHYDEKARRYIERKDQMKSDGIPSPDIWDSLSFAFLENAHYLISESTKSTATTGKVEKAAALADAMFDDA